MESFHIARAAYDVLVPLLKLAGNGREEVGDCFRAFVEEAKIHVTLVSLDFGISIIPRERS